MRLLLIFLVFLSINAFSQNPLWVNTDKKLISKFIESYNSDSSNIINFFPKPSWHDSIAWGKNFYSIDLTKPGGYISIRATFLYNQNGLIGYKIKPQMPDEPELIDKYKKWYSDLFKFQDSTTIQPIYSNYQNWIRPLNDYDGKLNINNQSDSFKVYFSIESGAIYGYGNGWGGLRQNRMLFEKLLPELSSEQIILLMYSKNCITRLHAFHYYLTHKSDFTDTQKIDIWMEQIFTNHPRIQCSDTDVIYTCDAKEQLLIYVNHDLSEK